MAAPSPLRRPALLPAFLWGSAAMVVLVLVQAAMAGQALFDSFDIAVHGYVGNASFALGVVLFLVALFGRLPRTLVVLAVVVAVALFGQTGLGYVGREQAVAASVHIPLGVTIFGLAAVQATLALVESRRRT